MRVNFARADLVRIAKKLPPEMSHFSGKGKLALIVHSDAEGSDYALLILTPRGLVYSAWYPRELLKLEAAGNMATELIVRTYDARD